MRICIERRVKAHIDQYRRFVNQPWSNWGRPCRTFQKLQRSSVNTAAIMPGSFPPQQVRSPRTRWMWEQCDRACCLFSRRTRAQRRSCVALPGCLVCACAVLDLRGLPFRIRSVLVCTMHPGLRVCLRWKVSSRSTVSTSTVMELPIM